ncbi:MAG: phosphoribosylformylglycinamidine cyclo-ligase [Acidimicrobiales bacterium]
MVTRLLDVASGGLTYAAAGVSIDAGDDAVARIRSLADSTTRPGALGTVGGFGGLFDLGALRYRDPVLVATTDGVGTKINVAREVGRFDTIGVDLVAMLVDDLVCVGAEPLFVLDYVAVGSLDPARVAEVVAGVAEGCRVAGAALLGGETAEHPGAMKPDDLDLAGFALGVVERDRTLGPERVRAGDRLLGLPSTGLRSNGYSLVRRVFGSDYGALDRPAYPGATVTLADELLRPSVIYAPAVLSLTRDLGLGVHAVAHVTGGGIVGNVPRLLPDGHDAVIDMESFATPEIFFEVQRRGSVSADEMVRVFNCGLGMVVAVDPEVADAAVSLARAAGHAASLVGEVRAGRGEVVLV